MTRNPIIAILIILVALGIFFGYVSPTYYGAVAADNEQIAGYDNALAAAATYQAKVNSLASQRDAIPPAELARLEKFLPDGVDNVQLILDLDALAARSGLTLANFGTADSSSGATASNATPATGSQVNGSASAPGMTPQASSQSNTSALDSIDVTVSATGTYSAMRSFMTGVEASLRLIDVVGMTVKQSDTGVYTYQMTLRLYWLR